ncbi:MAG: UpxY family transcription antiterminator [Desulfobacteraceae bacterium]|nr:MAG: UpxY family transcription antiterminator [Desulfobacteraceae bacterium]
MDDIRLTPQWYVLHTKSRHEVVVFEGLQKKSVEAFLPRVKVRSTRRDRKALIHTPLFPGYLFIRTDLQPRAHLEIVKTAGVVRLIGTSQGPVPVPAETVQSLKIMVASERPITTGSTLRPGDRVMVVQGPFAGVTGTFTRYRSQDRVIVHIDALGQYAAVEVNEEDVEILPPVLS